MNRRDLIKSALAGAAIAGSAEAAAPRAGEPSSESGSHWERPPKQQGNNLNVIVLVSDTFRADNLEAYGSEWIQTPNLNKFAEQSIVFKDAYPEGMPTIPTRRNLYTGRRILPTYYFHQHEPVQLPGWHHLYNEDVTLSETLQEAGYLTALVADLPHLQRPGRNFHRGFGYYEWVRGQEVDFYAQAPRKQPDYSDLFPADYLSHSGLIQSGFLNQYTANRRRWLKHGDSIAEQTAKNAISWLRENHDQGPFYLQVEIFDPHEPWDPPAHFLEKYLQEPSQHSWPEPPYTNLKVPEEGVKRLRANYAGEASNVDYWYGKVLDTVGELGLLNNTVIVFLSDHGTLLNEQGQWTKGPEKLRTQVTHVPLILRVPGDEHAGKRVSGLVQLPDVVPTVLGRLNLKPSPRVTGEDLWPLVTGAESPQRDHVVSAFGYIASVRTPEWNYSAIWNKEKYQGTYKPQLYNSNQDPHELRDVADQNLSVVKDLQAKLERYIASGWEITRGSFNEKAG
jgi:arylsulfatase A-like enzyme